MGGSGWRWLAAFWVVLVLALGAGGAALQVLGPPPRDSVRGATPAEPPSASAQPNAAQPNAAQSNAAQPTAGQPAPNPQAAGKTAAADAGGPKPAGSSPGPSAPAALADPRSAVFLTSPGRDMPGPIAGPDPSLMEPARSGGGTALPRMDSSGRAPMQAYAAGFDRTTRRPRIGILLAGIGMNEAESLDAIRKLPDAVTLAVSPYSQRLRAPLETARIAGHEFLLSLPMEPQGFPQNNAGDHALMTGADPAQNALRLDWALSRFAGYAGVTNALGVLRGERFSAATDLFAPVLAELARRGLFFVDARPGAGYEPGVWSASVDLVIDEPADVASVDAKLVQLETLAREHGAAIGLAGAPRPAVLDRVLAWSAGLTARGMTLAPMSALVQWHPAAAPTSAAVPGAKP